jgi:hypothetical protein
MSFLSSPPAWASPSVLEPHVRRRIA